MLSSLLLLATPFALIAPASAAPNPKLVELGLDGDAKCAGALVTSTITVTETFYADDIASSVPETRFTHSVAFSTHVAVPPAAQTSASPSPLIAHESQGQAPQPTQVSQAAKPTAAGQATSASPGVQQTQGVNATGSGSRAGSFHNALYFTNW